MTGSSKATSWAGWVSALLLTVLLQVWHLPFSPFSSPGARANEAAVIFLMVMAVRWVLLAALIVAIARSWSRRLRLTGWASAGLLLGLFALHLLLGLLNAGLWNAWISAGGMHALAGDWLLAGAYFLIPTLMLLALGVVTWSVPSPPAAAGSTESIPIHNG
jgi:hypothetical protein